MDDDLEFALGLADAADLISLERFRADDLVVETKPDLTPVTEADRAVEEAIRALIAAERPDDMVVGEEFGADAPTSRARGSAEAASRWIVDPIDGTKNFIRGIPVWGTLIALERGGDQVAAVASAPALGRRWWAARGQGAFAGGLAFNDGSGHGGRIHVSAIDRIEDAQVCFGGLRTWEVAGRLEGFLDLVRRSWRARGFGDFWMHMLVAEGTAEVAAEAEVSLWDLAAVKLIVEEAGGHFTDLAGRATPEGGSGVSTNGLLHDEVLGILSS